MRRTAIVAAAAVCLMGLRAAPAAEVVLLEDFDATWEDGRWQFSNGPEFPGAKGTFERAEEPAGSGKWCGRLTFDFAGGGNYVAAVLPLKGAPETAAVRVRIMKPRSRRLTFRYTDRTGQTVQKGFLAPDDTWADVLIPMAGWTGHWGGANDGRIHGPPTQIAFLAENTGRPNGAVLIDDVRLIKGKAEEGAGMMTSEIVAYEFGPAEGWHAGGAVALDGRTLKFDFTGGGRSAGVVPPDASLLGVVKEVRVRALGNAPAHPVRVQFATHFMMFEKTVGRFKDVGDGRCELAFQAPPGEGWRWFGGENDGKLHGPLRLRGLFLDAADTKDAGEIELVDIRVKAQCAPGRACVLLADHRPGPQGGEFVATVRSMAPEPLGASLRWTVRDWAGNVLASGISRATLPTGAKPTEVSVPVPAGKHPFLEAEFVLDAPDQVTPATQAYYTAPIKPHGTADLDPASPFGMGIYLYRYPGSPEGLKEMDRAAQMAQDAGVKWSREEFGWARIEPQRGKFDWTFYDQVVATAKRHGVSIYGLLSYWSAWTKPYTPEGIDDYCRYAAACAERYSGNIHHWEVWNEPNIFFWQGPRDMYADLLKKAYAAIKKANPKALVLGVSTAGIDTNFIKRTIDLGAPFDILTIHPYRGSLNDRGFIGELQKTAELARRPDGALREVWITEMGWATHVPHNGSDQGFSVTTQRDQAQLLARAYIDAVASGVAPNISWYDFRNDGTDRFNFEHNLGVMTRDFRIKPAYRALATVTRMLKGKRVEKPLDLGAGVVAYRFVGADGKDPVTVLWSTDEPRTIGVPVEGQAALTDLMGRRETLKPSEGKATVPLQPETPVFLTQEP